MAAPRLIYKDRTFIWIGTPADRALPKNAGLRYYGDPYFYWSTLDWEKAAQLIAYADPDCRAVLENAQGVRPLNIEASRATDADIDIPAPAGLEYMGFQKAGIAFANERENTLIADEMGLGKTIQALGFINANPDVKQVLIVCPASLKINWRREANRWLVREYGTTIVDGGYFPQGLGPTIRILNYDQLHKYARSIERYTFDLLIADEAHYGKNPNARRSKHLHGIKARRTLYLTGTPICNRPKELWPLLCRLDPTRWNDKTWAEYRDTYCNASPETPHGARALARLQQILRSTIMVRRLKKDVLKDLPAKRRQVIELPAGSAAAAVRAEQQAVERFTVQMVERKASVELMKASEDPADYVAAVKALKEGMGEWFGALSKLRHDTALAKVPAVRAHIEDALDTGEKVIFFAHHHDVIDAIMSSFGHAVKIDGTMNQRDRQASVDAFQNDPDTKLFVGSIQAAGVGLTLTAAKLVIFGELDWTPGNMTQAEDRAHRIGQLDSVLVQHLVLEESLDATMAKKLVAKQMVIDAALDNEIGEELGDQPLVPLEDNQATEGVTRHQVEREAESMTPQEVNAVHEALRILTAADGLNMVDAAIGRSLAAYGWLSRKQAALGRRIVRKYSGQIPADLMEQITPATAPRVREAAGV